jgi:hypothetical protein
MSYITRAQKIKTDFSANGQILALDVSQLNFARFEFSGTYNFTGTFETSTDSTNGTDGVWFPLQVVMTNAATVALSHATANATQAYEANVAGVTWVRVRLSAYTSAGTHRVGIFGVDTSVEPAPVVSLTGSTLSIGVIATPFGSAISAVTAANTNASSQKSSPGSLFELTISNPTATAISVKLYNKASAPTVGTDVPVLTQTVAAGATNSFSFGQNGKRFTTGIAMAATALPAATDTGVAVAGVQIHGTYI